MFLISKLFTYFILPPGVFIAIILIALLFIAAGLKKTGVYSLLLTAFLLYLLSVEPVKDFLLLPLENKFHPFEISEAQKEDVIVVLGGGMYDKSPAKGMKPSLSPDSLKRTVYAFYLQKELNLPVIVSGGKVFQSSNTASSAEVMKSVMVRLGAGKEKIYTESESKNTAQNAEFTAKIMNKYGWSHALLVTSAYHMPRSVLSFGSAGVHVTAAPTDYKTDRSGYFWYSFMPQMSYLKDSWNALHEYAGLLYYSIIKP
ncbi:MAG: YdcF family protein [Flexistipes sinusarabici]|uniref:YdcF family protein n=1 Tax=Flexistipes sinusarabici TaxID=2352 RepID=A0A5D0MML5_FLESI|nr:YdcF family protein [Flexistipes sinusarabici]TYB34894.1 MAG: YdcF family protein [Flexistipes sinusarabici]